jgi:hypothetical protein
VYSVIVLIISSYLVLVLNNWYQSTFLGQSCGQIFFIFAVFFFGEEKKRAATFQTFSV